MAVHPTLWFPGANGAQCGADATDSGDVNALLAQADFLLSALADEIERSRDLRVGYWWHQRRRQPA
jgi:hypothetical protein